MKYKFKLHIRKSQDNQFYGVLVGKNGEDTYVQETNKGKGTVIKTANSFFPGVEIIDETKK